MVSRSGGQRSSISGATPWATPSAKNKNNNISKSLEHLNIIRNNMKISRSFKNILVETTYGEAYRVKSEICDYEFNNSKAAMNFMNEVAKMAEEYKRSPEIHFHSKKSVSIKIISEDPGEITEDDAFKSQEQVQKITDEHIQLIDECYQERERNP